MTKQLTVRLADDLVEFIDRQVAQGRATSRASLVTSAVERARRREIAEHDAEILARTRQDEDDLDALATLAAQVPLDDLA